MACDFFVVLTATFRTLYVFLLMGVGTRRSLHHNSTAHPTADWNLQQFRETLPCDHPYRFVLHDRDNIFSRALDKAVTGLGVRVLRTPVRAPKANAYRERLGGSRRRECLDFLIPLSEGHLRRIVKERELHCNRGRYRARRFPYFFRLSADLRSYLVHYRRCRFHIRTVPLYP
ncbi:MAG: transposase [Acidobacteria bacterium]|nr:transposase [Acidobacteriota bacterium]